MQESLKNEIPPSILEIGKLIADLEFAARGEKAEKAALLQGRKKFYEFTVSTTDQDGIYKFSNSRLVSSSALDWLEQVASGGNLPINGPNLDPNNICYFTMKETDAARVKDVIMEKMVEFAVEHKTLRKEELRAEFSDNVKELCNQPDFFASLGLQNDLGSRTPNNLYVEALLAHAWKNAEKVQDDSPVATFINGLKQALNELDTEELLNPEEKLALISQTADTYIKARKLGPTLEEIGNDITFMPDVLGFR